MEIKIEKPQMQTLFYSVEHLRSQLLIGNFDFAVVFF